MVIFVTGGSGFLGKELIRLLLERGYTVRSLSRKAQCSDHPALTWIRGSLTDMEALLEGCRGAAAVMHVAALTGVWGAYKSYFKANILGTQHLLVAARTQKVPYFVYTSSPSVVYNGKPILEGTEGLSYLSMDCHAPHYAFTKAYAEGLVLRSHSPDGLKTLALRPHLIWGQGDPHLVARILSRAARGRLWQVGEGDALVSITHVSHAAQAHLDALEALKESSAVGGEAYFINDAEPVNLWDWIRALVEAAGLEPLKRKLSLRTAYRLGAVFEAVTPSWIEPPMTRFLAHQLGQSHTFSIHKAQNLLGYNPNHVYAQAQLEALKNALKGSRTP